LLIQPIFLKERDRTWKEVAHNEMDEEFKKRKQRKK